MLPRHNAKVSERLRPLSDIQLLSASRVHGRGNGGGLDGIKQDVGGGGDNDVVIVVCGGIPPLLSSIQLLSPVPPPLIRRGNL